MRKSRQHGPEEGRGGGSCAWRVRWGCKAVAAVGKGSDVILIRAFSDEYCQNEVITCTVSPCAHTSKMYSFQSQFPIESSPAPSPSPHPSPCPASESESKSYEVCNTLIRTPL
jgi:hypothetical protein